MQNGAIKQHDIFDPPGGILIWILIFLELTTFGLALIFMASASKAEPEVFHKSRLLLNPGLGAVNTMVLLCSGYFMASALHFYRTGADLKSARFLHITMLFGWGFILIKGFEFYLKIGEGLTIGNNTFFIYYWLLMGFHFIHVLLGLAIIFWLNRTVFKEKNDSNLEFFDAGAAFWHLCDLIWLLIFPIIYLFF